MVKAFNSSENFLKLEEAISPLFPFIQGPDQKPPQVCHFFSWFMDFSASFKEHIYKSEACSPVLQPKAVQSLPFSLGDVG